MFYLLSLAYALLTNEAGGLAYWAPSADHRHGTSINVGTSLSSNVACRPIFDPFEIHIVNSKSAGGNGGKAGEGGNYPAAGAPSKWQASRTLVTIPALDINMDSREFQITLDVIRKVGMASVSPSAQVAAATCAQSYFPPGAGGHAGAAGRISAAGSSWLCTCCMQSGPQCKSRHILSETLSPGRCRAATTPPFQCPHGVPGMPHM